MQILNVCKKNHWFKYGSLIIEHSFPPPPGTRRIGMQGWDVLGLRLCWKCALDSAASRGTPTGGGEKPQSTGAELPCSTAGGGKLYWFLIPVFWETSYNKKGWWHSEMYRLLTLASWSIFIASLKGACRVWWLKEFKDIQCFSIYLF